MHTLLFFAVARSSVTSSVHGQRKEAALRVRVGPPALPAAPKVWGQGECSKAQPRAAESRRPGSSAPPQCPHGHPSKPPTPRGLMGGMALEKTSGPRDPDDSRRLKFRGVGDHGVGVPAAYSHKLELEADCLLHLHAPKKVGAAFGAAETPWRSPAVGALRPTVISSGIRQEGLNEAVAAGVAHSLVLQPRAFKVGGVGIQRRIHCAPTRPFAVQVRI